MRIFKDKKLVGKIIPLENSFTFETNNKELKSFLSDILSNGLDMTSEEPYRVFISFKTIQFLYLQLLQMQYNLKEG